MANSDIDYDKIQKQLAILMTNSTALMSKMFDLFVTTTPMDVKIQVYTTENNIETLIIPNRAKGNIPAQYGDGTPEGNIEANYGTIYIDQSDGKVYIKTSLDGVSGWLEIITSQEMNEHNADATAHIDTLARIHGDPDTEFNCSNIDFESDDSLAVNKYSLFRLLGGLDGLVTENKNTIVEAINEAVDINDWDNCCVTRCSAEGIDSISNEAKILVFERDSGGHSKIRIKQEIIVTTADGIKHTVPPTVIDTSKFENSTEKDNSKYAIFVSLEEVDKITEMDGTKHYGMVALPGDYYISVHKPYMMVKYDSWLDIGNTPYTLYVKEKSGDHLTLVRHDYVYIGTAEEVRV